MPAATTSAAGHLTTADWNTFNKQAGNANLTSIAALTFFYNHFFSKNDGCRNILYILKTGCFIRRNFNRTLFGTSIPFFKCYDKW
jgi:hypothetical protein